MSKNKRQKRKQQGQLHFGEFPVFDAEASLIIKVTQDDIDNATPLDPNQCAIAQAVRRMYGSERVAFHPGGICYVDIIDERGNLDPNSGEKRVILRFLTDSKGISLIKQFDETHEALPCQIFLNPPTFSKSLEHINDPIQRAKTKVQKAESLKRRKAQKGRLKRLSFTDDDPPSRPRRVIHLRTSSHAHFSTEPRYDVWRKSKTI